MPTFRILHVSDFHIAGGFSPWSRHSEAALSHLVAFARNLTRDRVPDLVAVTGDLVETGSSSSIDEARAYFRRRFRNALADPRYPGGAVPLFAVPGNHDVMRSSFSITPRRPGNPKYSNEFVSWDLSRDAKSGLSKAEAFGHKNKPRDQFARLLYAGGRDGAALLVAGVDFTLDEDFGGEGLYDYLGLGKAYLRRAEQLDDILEAARGRNSGAELVLLCHFDPTHAPLNLRLESEERLMAVARKRGVGAILCGHTHSLAASRRDSAGPRVLNCGSTACLDGWLAKKLGGPPPLSGLTLQVLNIDLAASRPAVYLLERFQLVPGEGFVPLDVMPI